MLVDGITLVFKSRSLISVRLKVVEVKSVHFLIRQAVSFLDSASVLIHHPVVSSKDIFIVSPRCLGISDERAAIVANLIGDVVVVETEDWNELWSAWERVETKLFVQCISVSDLEGRCCNALRDNIGLRFGQRLSCSGWVKTHQL